MLNALLTWALYQHRYRKYEQFFRAIYGALTIATDSCSMVTNINENRRRAHRIKSILPVRFRIGDGEYCPGETMNFTAFSLAIRTNVDVTSGTGVCVELADLPIMEGTIIRIFDGGFAVRFSEASINLVAHAFCTSEQTAQSLPDRGPRSRAFSDLFEIDAPCPAWGRFATTRENIATMRRHSLSIIAASEQAPPFLNSAWVEIGKNRWVARVLGYAPRGKQAIALIHFNDWQMRLAAEDGFKITMHFDDHPDWPFICASSIVASHMNSLEDREERRLTA